MKKQTLSGAGLASLLLIAICLVTIQNVNAQYWNLTGNAGTSASTNFIGTTDNVSFKIRTKNLVRVTVTNAGKVGIGTTSPYSQLTVSAGNSAVTERGIWSGQFSSSNLAAVFGGRKARGTEAAPLAVAASDYTVGVCAQNFDGGNYINNGSIGFRVTGAVTPGNVPGEWYFGATNNNDVDPYLSGTVRMVVQSSGNVGIGTITPTNKLSVAGNVDFSGKVGIGTTTPDGKLDVTDYSLPTLANFDGGNSMYIALKENGLYRGYLGSFSGAAEDVDFGTGGTNITGAVNFTIKAVPKMTINSSGRVGIGTITPTQKLEVAGTIYSNSGGFKFPDGTTQVTAAVGGANSQLSNLGTTAINTSINPATTNTVSLGTATNRWANLYSTNADIKNGSGLVASFDGGLNTYIRFLENGVYRGYIGSFSGAAEDVDFGTGAFNTTGAINFTIQATPKMTITSTGSVGIGTSTPGYKLDVCGAIRGKEVRVETGWCDYVFANDYKLAPLSDVESFINANKHLPDVTPGSEIERNGLEVGKVSAQMIKKIEELTLYVIAQEKAINILKIQNEQLQLRMNSIDEKGGN